jgi:putative endonuclease
MHYVYVLRSQKDLGFYTGYSENLKERFKEHQSGKCSSTKNRRPFQLVYYEACVSKKDALIREKYLKSSWGKRYVKNRIKYSA